MSSGWVHAYQGYAPEEEGLREALCTLGNGVFATRGAAAEASADDVHYPGTYLAGGYDRARSEVEGRTVENEDLVNCPNWLCLTFRPAGGEWFHVDVVEVLDYRQELRMREGLLLRELRFRDAAGRTTRWRERRLVSLARPHLGALSIEVAPEDWEGELEVRSALDGAVVNGGVPRYRDLEGRHLKVLEASQTGEERIRLVSRTLQSRLEVALAARTRLFQEGQRLATKRSLDPGEDRVAERIHATAGPQRPLRIEKVVALHTGRDCAISEPGLDADRHAREAPDFATLQREQRSAWGELWEDLAVEVEVDAGDGESADAEAIQRKLRLHDFHLMQTVSAWSLERDVGVPARGWHGEAYRGHIFWDELFIVPLMSQRRPALARDLLLYRYRRLDRAREAARDAGFRGALFPWQSGSDGREESQSVHLNPRSGRWLPDPTHRQRHIGCAIAYNVWHYHQATGDDEFLYRYGAELFVEIARFWASRVEWDDSAGRYRIRGVMGPDEYHTAYPSDPEEKGVDDNAYTNAMAAWVLREARDLLDILPSEQRRRLESRLALTDEEVASWREIARRVRLPFHDGILSQFEGYQDLEELDWKGLRERHGDIQRLDRILEAEEDSPNRYKASKQADVLMLFYLFSSRELQRLFQDMGYAWDPDLVPRNIDYYLARTSHGSTLSRVTHAWVLARAERPSWERFHEALDSDVEDVQGGTTREGIHLGAMAGTLDLVLRCYTGSEVRGNALHFNPALPGPLRRLRFRLHHRGHVLDVDVGREGLSVSSLPRAVLPITLAHRGRYRTLAAGGRCRFDVLTAARSDREVASLRGGRADSTLA